MADSVKVREVFNSFGQPKATYVERDSGKYENELSSALDAQGQLCLLAGPSKTGKTTLYSKVLAECNLEPIVVRCDASIGASEFWRRALEKIDFERLSSTQSGHSSTVSGTGKVGGKIGWAWLASLLGEVSLGVNKSMDEHQIRERILSEPSPDHLIPVLKHLPVVLVVEDFHYLEPDIKKKIFQQWKVFVDNEVSAITVETTHHTAELAYANRDLVGRVSQIELSTWKESDLAKIAVQGFEYLGIPVPRSATSKIAQECAGLPIIAQETCYRLLADKGIREIQRGDKTAAQIYFTGTDVSNALHTVAIKNYSQYDNQYERLIVGPRTTSRRRQYNTYELVLSTFAQDPLTFLLQRQEIEERLQKIPIRAQERPPARSVTSTLKALANVQSEIGIELLEWSDKDQRLYILEPAFLFYLRWKEDKQPEGGTLIERLLKRLGIAVQQG